VLEVKGYGFSDFSLTVTVCPYRSLVIITIIINTHTELYQSVSCLTDRQVSHTHYKHGKLDF